MRFLPKLFKKAIHKGELRLDGPDGFSEIYGTGEDGPLVTIKVTDPSFDWKIFLNPELKAAEAYMKGVLQVTRGDVMDLLEIFYTNRRAFDKTPMQALLYAVQMKFRRVLQHNPVARASANVRHHYDIGDDLFDLFLDEDWQYSCAYFPTGKETLEQAQLAKKRHIAAKLNLKPGMHVLDIGCGWGGLAIYLAQVADVKVTGITLSNNQAAKARKRVSDLGLSDRVNIEIIDYRQLEGKFDRVVSVGMLEHVGAPHLSDYFFCVRDFLKPEGVAVIHSISTKSPPGITGPFIRKYIFPGGYSPSLSEITRSVEKTGLWNLDIESWRKHYGYTLREWRARFAENREKAVELYDEELARMWEFYLAACEGVFFYGSSHVVQLILGRERDGVPINRDFIGKAETALKKREKELGIFI